MTPKTPNEKLNFVLDYIKQQRSYNDLYREIEEHANFKGQFSPGEIDLIMDKLRDDGYIDYIAGQQISKTMRASDGLEIRKNFNGMIFHDSGAYVQKAINDKKIEDRKESREKQLLYGTWGVAVGAVALVLWEMYKTFVIEGHSICH